MPTIRELCAASHVSDRRLRLAFARAYGTPPAGFFRRWALNRAYVRLSAADPKDGLVTSVATDLGFAHLGRFAGSYKDLFGRSPSTTLATRD